MIDLRVIEPPVSPYSSSILLIPKQDRSVRFGIDFQKVKVTEFDAEPMLNIQEVIDKLSGNKYFTKVDLSKGYWQVELTDDSKKGKRKVQGVPQSQTAALPRPQEEEETDKSKQAHTEQTYEKH